jgi:hypothetical protein
MYNVFLDATLLLFPVDAEHKTFKVVAAIRVADSIHPRREWRRGVVRKESHAHGVTQVIPGGNRTRI